MDQSSPTTATRMTRCAELAERCAGDPATDNPAMWADAAVHFRQSAAAFAAGNRDDGWSALDTALDVFAKVVLP